MLCLLILYLEYLHIYSQASVLFLSFIICNLFWKFSVLWIVSCKPEIRILVFIFTVWSKTSIFYVISCIIIRQLMFIILKFCKLTYRYREYIFVVSLKFWDYISLFFYLLNIYSVVLMYEFFLINFAAILSISCYFKYFSGIWRIYSCVWAFLWLGKLQIPKETLLTSLRSIQTFLTGES